ncbi:MAG: hypothetical protein ACRD9W_19550, partial [Terriglobia bacterium]
MNAILNTIARSNKYGEPEYHLRSDLLLLAHALAGDLVDLPLDAARSVTDVGRLKTTASARRAVFGAIEAVRPQSLATRQAQAKAGNAAFQTLIVGTAQDALKLDLFDVANAALDVLLSVDDKGKQHGVLSFSRPEADEVAAALLELAAARPFFGGPAEPNSPQDLIGCKAFAILVALAGSRIEGAEQLRNAVLQYSIGSALGLDVAIAGLGQNTIAKVRADVAVSQAALVAVGRMETGIEAERTAYALFINVRSYVSVLDSGQRTFQGPEATQAILTLMRSLVRYAGGAGEDGLNAAINRHMDDMIESARLPGGAGITPGMREFIEMWENTAPQWGGRVVGLCHPEGAPPQIALFAKGVFGLILIGRLYQS